MNPMDIIARAKRCGLIRPGVTFTFAQICEYLPDAEESYAEVQAELAVERYYENRGWEEARAQEAWEAARGIFA